MLDFVFGGLHCVILLSTMTRANHSKIIIRIEIIIITIIIIIPPPNFSPQKKWKKRKKRKKNLPKYRTYTDNDIIHFSKDGLSSWVTNSVWLHTVPEHISSIPRWWHGIVKEKKKGWGEVRVEMRRGRSWTFSSLFYSPFFIFLFFFFFTLFALYSPSPSPNLLNLSPPSIPTNLYSTTRFLFWPTQLHLSPFLSADLRTYPPLSVTMPMREKEPQRLNGKL